MVHAWMRKVDKSGRASPICFADYYNSRHVVQQIRYDMSLAANPGGTSILLRHVERPRNYSLSRLESASSAPNYLRIDLVLKWIWRPFIQVKFERSRDRGHGDYFVGFFFRCSLPTGIRQMRRVTQFFRPTLALPRVWTRDVQTTVGASLPVMR